MSTKRSRIYCVATTIFLVDLGKFASAIGSRTEATDDVTRRALLAATAAGGIFTAARAAGAETSEPVPQPQRPGRGGTDPGPRNLAKDRQNPDLLVPPLTDHGTLPNLRFSFSDSHVRQETGGWTVRSRYEGLGFPRKFRCETAPACP